MIPWRNYPWPGSGSAATTRTLLRAIERFCQDNGLSRCGFATEAAKDPRLVGDLRNGRELRPKTIERIKEYMGSADF
jgi:hypothetical protein